jgi:hypothetical protein
MKRVPGIASVLVLAVLIFSCGGGGDGGSNVPSTYTGVTTAAVITDNNASEIALGAYQGGDLAANTGLILAPAGTGGVPAGSARPKAVTLVQAMTKAAVATMAPPATGGPSLRAPVEESGVIDDGLGGQASYTLHGDDQSGVFTGSFSFIDFHGDGGGVVNGNVAVSGSIAQDFIHILFNFQSVRIVDGASDVNATGTVDLTIDLTQLADSGTATLNLVFNDNFTRKMVWLSDYRVENTVGTGNNDVTLSGRIYLHDYGYVDVETPVPFHYLDGATHPASGQMTVTGDQGKSVRLTADSETQATVDVDSDADGQYDDLTIVVSW